MSASGREREAMRRALTLAARGPRGVNPQVGAVLLSAAGEVLAEGWHRGAGTAHAEVAALAQLEAGAARGATAVVTLEPCNHVGRTGPCTEALLAAGVTRVVYGTADPGIRSGGGAARLRAAGVDVVGGVCAEEVSRMLASWTTVAALGRPHVTVKWAQSLDGRAAAADGTSRWITGADARADVHERRSRADAILVGTGTVLTDDPALTARRPDGSLFEAQPQPVVLGVRAVPAGAAVRRHPRGFRQDPGTNLFGEPDPQGRHDAGNREVSLLARLGADGIQSVFVEGGPTVASAFLRAGLADELLVYLAPTLLGAGADGDDRPALRTLGVETIAQQHRLEIAAVDRLGEDLRIVAHPRKKD